MKGLAIVFLGLAALGTSRADAAPPAAPAWRGLGPGHGAVRRLAFAAGGRTVYAATTDGGIHRSDDGGATWRAAAAGLGARNDVYVITPAGDDGRTLVAAPWEEGILRTTDGGSSWRRANDGLPTASGLSWPEIRSLASDRGSPEILYAGGAFNVFRSSDGGATWSPTALSNQSVVNVVASPGVVYASALGGFFRTTDSGATWARASMPSGEATSALAADPRSPWTLYAATYRGLSKTTDGGDSWFPLERGLPNPGYPDRHTVVALAVDLLAPDTLYAVAAGSGLYRSDDAGRSWSLVPGPADVTAVASDPARAGRLLAGTNSAGVSESTDRGETWRARNDGLDSATVSSVAAGVDRGLLFAVAGTPYVYGGAPYGPGALFRSTDAGASWTPASGLAGCASGAIHATSGTAETVLAGCNDLFRSTDGGASFHRVHDADGGRVERFAASPDPAIVYASGGTRGSGPNGDSTPLLLKSTNGGASWSSRVVPFLVAALAASPASADLVFVGARGYGSFTRLGIFRSTNGGGSFEKTPFPDVEVSALTIDAATGALFAGTADGLFRSTDDGESWARFGKGVQNRSVTSLAFDASGALVAGTWDGIFRCTSGDAFESITGDLGATRVLTVSSAGKRLYAGTLGGGVYVLDGGPDRVVPDGGSPVGNPIRR